MHSFVISLARCHCNMTKSSVFMVGLTQTEENNFHLTMDVICDDWSSYVVLPVLKTPQSRQELLYVLCVSESYSCVKSSPLSQLLPQGQGPQFNFIDCWLIEVSNKQEKEVLPCTDDVRLTLNSTKHTLRAGLALWDAEYVWWSPGDVAWA